MSALSMEAVAAGTPPQRPDGATAPADAEQVRRVAREFETVLLSTWVRSLQATSPNAFGTGAGAEVYADWFASELASLLASQGGLGLREPMLRQLGLPPEERAEIGPPRHQVGAAPADNLSVGISSPVRETPGGRNEGGKKQ